MGHSSSSPGTPRTKVFTRSPVLTFHLHRLLRVLKLYHKVASSQLPAPQIAPRTKVVPSHQFSSSSSSDTPRTKVVLQSRQCSPAFRALDAHDLRRGLRGHRTNRTLACISRTRHARSAQRVVRAPDKSHSRLHFAHSTRTISAEGCVRMGQIALSPAFRALDTHDLRRGSREHGTNHTLACISHTRHARSPQRVARQVSKTSVSYETSSKSQAETSIGAHTHHAALPSSFAIPAPPNNIRSHANPNVTAT